MEIDGIDDFSFFSLLMGVLFEPIYKILLSMKSSLIHFSNIELILNIFIMLFKNKRNNEYEHDFKKSTIFPKFLTE
jgi:hypothetical protein